MSKITDHWVNHYLESIKAAYHCMTDDREFTVQQKDKIKKTINSLANDFKNHHRVYQP